MTEPTLTPELTRLMNNVRTYVPGAIDAALKLELFNTLDEFLRATNFWQEDVDFATELNTAAAGTTPDNLDYEVIGGEPGYIISLLGVVNSADVPVSATMPTLGTVTVTNSPSTVETLTATVSYTVVDPVDNNDYPQMPEGLLQRWGAGIMYGIIGRMQAQPAKPYTNSQLAIFNLRKFDAEVARARTAVLHANTYGAQSWSFPKFAPGRQR